MIFPRELPNRGLEIQTVGELDGSLESFINTWAVRDPLGRDSSYWNWVLKFPWMSPSEEDKAVQKRYAFSVFAKGFRQVLLRVSREDAIIAFLVMTLRDGRLCLTSAYYNDSQDAADVADSIRSAIADINPWVFISADIALNTELEGGFRFYFRHRSKRSGLYEFI